MRLHDLLVRFPEIDIVGNAAVEVSGITHDSRSVRAGWVFAALQGETQHGLDFIAPALENGASAILSDRRIEVDGSFTWLLCPSPRRMMAELAWALAGDPQKQLVLAGVTGTNGKSTTVNLISAMLEAGGHSVGSFGTLEYRLPDGAEPAERTTPEATDLAPLLRRLHASNGSHAVIEVSSHAIDRHRVAGLKFSVAAWTNLSRDHLDYHVDMESYFQVKRRLFDEYLADGGTRVIPVDEPWGARLLEDGRLPTVTYGLEGGDVHANELQTGLDGSRFNLVLPDSTVSVHLPLVGVHNLRNALAASAAASALKVSPEAIAVALQNAIPVVGRLERVDADLESPVFVDYAHTPDGLSSVLVSLRQVAHHKLIVVFGAGGDRDRGKRGPMGAAVGELADVAIVTSDNPRSEDPSLIAEAVAAGVREAGAAPVVILDRRQAIQHAIDLADENSIVVVAGKGHERYQLIGDQKIPFDDAEVVRRLAGGNA
jgi:UDP-N-acetylmuramoyl-L-alanyl-D-glutamate--2,6-diaminopimelate ligase